MTLSVAGFGTLSSPAGDANAPIPSVRTAFSNPPGLGPGIFLVASPELQSPHFGETVVLLVEHDKTGALGLVVNRVSKFTLNEAMPDLNWLEALARPLFVGGPVQPELITVLFRSQSALPGSEFVVADIHISASEEMLRSLLARKDAAFVVYAGYAGWGPGQLEAELQHGSWRLAEAESGLVFDRAIDDIWPELIRQTEAVWTRTTQDPTPHTATLPKTKQET